MGGSAGGGSTNIAPRDFGTELPTIGKGYKFQQQSLNDYITNNPLVSAANTGALNFFNGLGSLLSPLQSLFQNMPSITPTINSLQNQFGGLPQQLQQQFGGLPHQLQLQFGAMPQRIQELTGPLTNTARGYLRGIINNQGALSSEAARDVAQQTRTLANQYGTGRQLGTLGTELLNRQSAREARYNTALGQYEGATSQIGALDQLAQSLGINLATTRQGLGTQLAQVRQGLGGGLATLLQGLRSSDVATRSGLAGAIQNLQSGGLNQLLGVQQGNVSGFSNLTNPILSYISNLFSGNLQARIAQAQINQQGNIASDNKTSGLIGGALSSLGSIAGGIAMSDERVKENVRDIGRDTKEGIPLKVFNYKTTPKRKFLGVLAQDVEKKLPNQVLTDPASGVKFVVGFPVIEVTPMRKAA